MTDRRIRTALLGYGVAGSLFHAPFISAQSSYRLTYVVTHDPARAAAAQRRYPTTTVLDRADAVFDRADQLDLVVIATPPDTHYALASSALACGLDVVVDKPFTPTVKEAQALIDHATQAGQLLTVFQNRRWDTDFVTLHRLIGAGALGDVTGFESRFEWWKPTGEQGWKARLPIAGGGGILFDLGSHLIDQAIQLFGPVTQLAADVRRRGQDRSTDADDDTLLVLVHESGTRSTLTMNSWAARPGPRFHVRGTRGSYTKWGLDPQEDALASGMLPTDPAYGIEPRERWGQLTDAEQRRHLVPPAGSNYAGFYIDLARALSQRTTVPVDPRESLEVLRLIKQAHAGRLPVTPTRTESERANHHV